jgi:hypothetical protein
MKVQAWCNGEGGTGRMVKSWGLGGERFYFVCALFRFLFTGRSSILH